MSDEKQQVLETIREGELAEGYAAWAEDFRANPDPLAEIGLNDNLEPSDETNRSSQPDHSSPWFMYDTSPTRGRITTSPQ
jgi:hypothetical protein